MYAVTVYEVSHFMSLCEKVSHFALPGQSVRPEPAIAILPSCAEYFWHPHCHPIYIKFSHYFEQRYESS
jgi:hypothetical protein